MSDTLIIVLVALVLVGITVLPFLFRHLHMERHSRAAEAIAVEQGLKEPATLHPVVDPVRCINTGNCIQVCPEKDVLGIRDGHAYAVSPARCIGHGLCERSCPMEAIQLVFGSEKRGIDIPRIREDFQTNVPGVYIIGELGGMGLIRNAFEQAAQCIEGIARANNGRSDLLDVLIAGCGPAGLAASLHAKQHGLRFITLEKDEIGGAVRTYPRKKLVMTSPLRIPGYGVLNTREIRKEDLVQVWEDTIARAGLEVRTGESLMALIPRNGTGFDVVTNRSTYHTRRVVLALGRRGVPRRLGVPGEDLPKVYYSLLEPEEYTGDRVLVVGGGDAAIEAALALSACANVHLSYRGDQATRIKPANRERLSAAIASGAVIPRFRTEVREIHPDQVRLSGPEGDFLLPNDHLFVFIGGELPTDFLKSCGIEIDTHFGKPAIP